MSWSKFGLYIKLRTTVFRTLGGEKEQDTKEMNGRPAEWMGLAD